MRPTGIRRTTGLYPRALILFVTFINDMPSCVSPDTRIALFADDTKLYRTISAIGDQVALQNDLIALNNWTKTWDIDLNAKMCGASGNGQVKTRKRNTILLLLIINLVTTIYFLLLVSQNNLSIVITNNLNWNIHNNQVICKANVIFGLICHPSMM